MTGPLPTAHSPLPLPLPHSPLPTPTPYTPFAILPFALRPHPPPRLHACKPVPSTALLLGPPSSTPDEPGAARPVSRWRMVAMFPMQLPSARGMNSSSGSPRARSRARLGGSGPSTRRCRSTATAMRRSHRAGAHPCAHRRDAAAHGWQPILDGDNPIGLADDGGGGAISLEPGGQFELSGAPVETLHEAARETEEHIAQAKQVGARLGIDFHPGHEPALEPRPNPDDAEAALPHHDGLHAEGRLARPRHDVPHGDRAGEPRL